MIENQISGKGSSMKSHEETVFYVGKSSICDAEAVSIALAWLEWYSEGNVCKG